MAGDFNLNLIRYKVRGVPQFFETLLSNNFIPQVTRPTTVTEKSATLIANIFSDNDDRKCISGKNTTPISNHLPRFLTIEYLK